MGKDTYYFSHDYNPTADPKIQALIGEHGAVGYGIYWRIVEMLHEDNDHRLEHKRYMFIALAKQMSTHVEQVETIVEDCINVYELFCSDKSFFWSERVIRNIDKRNEISSKRSKAGKISQENRKNQTHVEHVLTHVQQTSTKERKGKENKENKNYKNILLSEIEISDYPNLNKDFFVIAKEFYELFKSNLESLNISTKTIEKTKGGAVDDIRLIVESDGHTIQDLRTVYAFLKKDEFWKPNIQSTSKLREKMQILLTNAKTNHNNGTTPKQNSSTGFSRKDYDPNNGIGDGTRLSDTKKPKVFSYNISPSAITKQG